MIPNYNNLSCARYELIQYLNSIGDHHLTRSLIEKAIRDINKVLDNDPTIRACTPKPGYVDKVLKKQGDINMTWELICDNCGKIVIDSLEYIEP